MTNKRHTRFCGIDVAKARHVACVIDRDNEVLIRSQAFRNDHDGYQFLFKRLQEVGQSSQTLVGMEATGHYWYGLRDFLTDGGHEVVVLNPIQTKRQAHTDIRVRKTDKVDAQAIARLLRNGDYKVSVVPSDFALTCRQLTRLRYRLIQQGARIKVLLWSRLHPVWPEYEALLSDPFCKTGRALLMAAPTPVDVVALGRDALIELVCSVSRGRLGPVRADKIWRAAQQTVGIRRGLDGARISIRSLLTQWEALTPIRRQLEKDIDKLADQLPVYIFTLPGIDRISAVSLFGETDPIETFASGAQLVAFAGLDTTVFQTGQFVAPRRRITKRGSPHLRHTLWTMAHRACLKEGDLHDYQLRRRAAGLHYLAAVTATAGKLCHVVWRILTDRRDYLPLPPAPAGQRRPARTA